MGLLHLRVVAGVLNRQVDGGVFTGAHEAVSGALISYGLILFASLLHGINGVGDGGVDAGIVAGVETIDRGLDVAELLRWSAVEDKGCAQVGAVGGEAEGLASAPAKTGDGDFAVGCGQLFGVIGHRVQIGGDDVLVKLGVGFAGGVHAGKVAGLA